MKEIIPWEDEDNRDDFVRHTEEYLIAAFPEKDSKNPIPISIFTKIDWSWKTGGTGWAWVPLTSDESHKKSHSYIDNSEYNTLTKDFCRMYAFDSFDEFLEYCIEFKKKNPNLITK